MDAEPDGLGDLHVEPPADHRAAGRDLPDRADDHLGSGHRRHRDPLSPRRRHADGRVHALCGAVPTDAGRATARRAVPERLPAEQCGVGRLPGHGGNARVVRGERHLQRATERRRHQSAKRRRHALHGLGRRAGADGPGDCVRRHHSGRCDSDPQGGGLEERLREERDRDRGLHPDACHADLFACGRDLYHGPVRDDLLSDDTDDDPLHARRLAPHPDIDTLQPGRATLHHGQYPGESGSLPTGLDAEPDGLGHLHDEPATSDRAAGRHLHHHAIGHIGPRDCRHRDPLSARRRRADRDVRHGVYGLNPADSERAAARRAVPEWLPAERRGVGRLRTRGGGAGVLPGRG